MFPDSEYQRAQRLDYSAQEQSSEPNRSQIQPPTQHPEFTVHNANDLSGLDDVRRASLIRGRDHFLNAKPAWRVIRALRDDLNIVVELEGDDEDRSKLEAEFCAAIHKVLGE